MSVCVCECIHNSWSMYISIKFVETKVENNLLLIKFLLQHVESSNYEVTNSQKASFFSFFLLWTSKNNSFTECIIKN